jgi:uncharacterized RDD family membrane protein YckC
LSSSPDRVSGVDGVLDTVVSAETPEGILLELRPAGLTARFYAFAVDWIVRIALLYGTGVVTSFAGGLGMAFWIIVLFALEWLYPVVFELTPAGATPGKRIFGLKVVMDNGLPVTAAASVTRNLLRAADFLPFFYGFAIVSVLVRRDSKRLGDIAAATLVVHERRAVSRIPTTELEPVAPARALAAEDQAAVIALAARANTLTPERLDELAALAGVVSGNAGQSGAIVTQRVLGVAQWLLGRRS